MAYGPDVRAEAKRLVVWHGYTPAQAAQHFDGSPAASTIDNWARTAEDPETGRNWYEERKATRQERFDVTRPENMARMTIKKIHEVLQQPGWDDGRGDQLAKLSKHLRHFVDPRHQVSMTLQVLTRFLQFVQEEYPEAARPELVRAVRDFKAQERSKIEG